MKKSSTDNDVTGYTVDNPVHKKFLRNPNFCLCLQEHIQNILAIPIAIIPRRLLIHQRNAKNSPGGYVIHLVDQHESRTEVEKTLSDCVRNLFETIQSQTFTDSKG
jgi:hypothetical protein